MFGTCAGDDEMQTIQFQMFEIMIVTGEVGLDVVLFEDRQDVLDNFRLVAMGQPGRIGWMMAEDQFPFRLGSGERAIEPLKLGVGILSGNITELRIVLILLHKRTGIEEEALQLHGRCHLMDLRVVPGWNDPSRVGVAIFKLWFAKPCVIVITQGDVPGNLQGRRVVNGFERLLPVEVIEGRDTTLIEIVTHGHNESCLLTFTGESHLPRNLPLA